MNKWRRHLATGSVVMALGVASMVPSLALAGNNSYGNQDNGANSTQHMDNSSGSSSSGSMGSSGKMNSGESMGSSGKMNSGGNMGSSDKMNSGGSMGSSGMGTHMSKSEVMHVQKALNQSGYKLSVDGVMGPHTKSALKKYQQSHGLQATGELTPQTMQKLGVSR